MIYYDIQTWSMECQKKTKTTGISGDVNFSLLTPQLKGNASIR
jgi:hypothetical protein